jgi:predicted GH43/DUF377 family glycosyl hydrolase
MVTRQRSELILKPDDLSPSRPELKVVGAFNPGVAEHDGETVLLVRVAESAQENRGSEAGLPRWEEGNLKVDWISDDHYTALDPRVVMLNETETVRLTFCSHLRVFRSRDGIKFHETDHWVMPEEPYEEFGVEDPRITEIDGTYWITYVAVSRHGAATALLSTQDFVTFERQGIIFACENKDVVIFPGKHQERFLCLHRPNPSTKFSPPEIWMASSSNMIDWGHHSVVKVGREPWQAGRVGAGPPPIEIEEGYLEIYHGNERPEPNQVGAYVAGALLFDREDPRQLKGFTTAPIMHPEEPYEKSGFVPDVVFPTGIVQKDKELWVYSGAADANVSLSVLHKSEVLSEMTFGEPT